MKYLFALLLAMSCFTGAEARPRPPNSQDYDVPLTDADKKNITFIITTLANNSMIKLMFYKSALNQAGDQIARVHPLKLLAYVFTNPLLKQDVKKIDGTPWNRFVQGMADSLEGEVQEGRMKPATIEDFAKTVGVNEKLLEPYVQSNQWTGFINAVRNNLPSTTTSTRP